MTEVEEYNLRIKCIELAQKGVIDLDGTGIVEIAQKYYWFITAKDKEEN